jgi:hypothetical protein
MNNEDFSEDSSETDNEGDDDGDLRETQLAHDAVWGQGARSLLAEVNRELAAVRSSTYRHRSDVNEAEGRFDVDCSGFVDYALARSAPQALEQLRAATVRRPLAKHFVALFSSLPRDRSQGHWRSVTRAADLVPGDILAWIRPADVSTHNTGHVMVVHAPVQRDPEGADTVVVPIADSTAIPHGKGDSRQAARANGLGTGEVILIVGPDDIPFGYRWSRSRTAHAHSTTVAMGRVQ